jgi:hypothetical protein
MECSLPVIVARRRFSIASWLGGGSPAWSGGRPCLQHIDVSNFQQVCGGGPRAWSDGRPCLQHTDVAKFQLVSGEGPWAWSADCPCLEHSGAANYQLCSGEGSQVWNAGCPCLQHADGANHQLVSDGDPRSPSRYSSEPLRRPWRAGCPWLQHSDVANYQLVCGGGPRAWSAGVRVGSTSHFALTGYKAWAVSRRKARRLHRALRDNIKVVVANAPGLDSIHLALHSNP